MKSILLVLLTALLTSAVFSQNATDEKEVRAVIQRAEDAYNAHDFSYAGHYDFMTSDAVLINPVGMFWKNRAEIIKGTQVMGAVRLKYESAKYNIKDLRFLSPTVALVVMHSIGKVEQDYNFPDGTKGGSKGDITEGMYLFTLVKQGKSWKITSMQVTHIDPNAANMNPIKNK
jgi:uncharacterized protein (TIGR02246 family)